MAKVTPIEKLDATISKILAEYRSEISQNVKEATKQVVKAGVAAVRSQSRTTFSGTGKYAGGWTSQLEEGRLSTAGVIYNKYPGLPHLLENGHAKRGGGRVPGRPHISVVESQIIEQFEKKVEAKL